MYPLSAFGLHSNGYHKGHAWPSQPFGTLRLHDCGCRWHQLEVSPGVWDYGPLDAYVARAQQDGIELILTLGQPPAWSARDPDARSPYQPGASSPPKDMAVWADYAGRLATRYAGAIRYWELWNEVNEPQFWTGDPEDLVEMEAVASKVLLAADPSNVLLTPSMQGGGYGYFERFLEAGGATHCGVVSWHFYLGSGVPEDVVPFYERVLGLMAEYGIADKPLWNTETGWLIPDSAGTLGAVSSRMDHWRRLDPYEAAYTVFQTYTLGFANGLDRVCWYGWDHRSMGLAEDRGRAPKPATLGLVRAREWLIGAGPLSYSREDGYWLCAGTRRGAPFWIVWADESRPIPFPEAGSRQEVIRFNGARSTAAGASLRVSAAPTYIGESNSP